MNLCFHERQSPEEKDRKVVRGGVTQHRHGYALPMTVSVSSTIRNQICEHCTFANTQKHV